MDESLEIRGNQFDARVDSEPAVMRKGAHWSIFMPTVVVALLYGGTWLLLASHDRAHGDLGRLLMLVCALGVPMLLVHAFLRYMSTCVTVTKSAVILERGWPRRQPITVVLGDVAEVETGRPLLGRLFGSGALIVRTRKNKRLVVNDLDDPDALAETLRLLSR